MLQDLRYAGRVILQGKAWSAMVVLSLALGIGANTALFSATNGLLLRKLPVEDPDTLVRLRHVGRNRMSNNVSEYGNITRPPEVENIGSTVSYAVYQELRNGQSDADRSRGRRPTQLGQRCRRRQRRNRDGIHRIRQLSPTAWRASDSSAAPCFLRTTGRTRRRWRRSARSIWTRRFGNDPAIVGKHDPREQHARDHRRRPAAGVHRRAARDQRGARPDVPARARSRSQPAGSRTCRARRRVCSSRPTTGCR